MTNKKQKDLDMELYRNLYNDCNQELLLAFQALHMYRELIDFDKLDLALIELLKLRGEKKDNEE